MLHRRGLLTALALLPLAACAQPQGTNAGNPTSSASAGEVLVYVPGAMAATTKGLTAAWPADRGTLTFEVGHTPMQREQLAQGAAPDVWIAANPADMKSAAEAGLVDAAGVRDLAVTELVVILAPGNPGKVTGLADLGKPGLKLLIGADSLPIGMATEKTLDKLETEQGAGFGKRVLANVASRELGVQPIVNKVTLGEADAGIVFVTDLAADRKGVSTLEVPDAVNTKLALSIAPVTAGKNKAGASEFITFMTSGPGQQALTKQGYQPPAA